MIEKLNRILSIVLIGTVIGVGVLWVIFREQPAPHTSFAEILKSEKVSEAPSETPIIVDKSVTTDSQKLRKMREQKLREVRESQEFKDFVATQPNSMSEFSRFFKSQGIELHHDAFLTLFTNVFHDQSPGESAAVLEPYMRERLAILARESLESGSSEEEFFEDVLVKFLIEEQNVPWMMTYFEGDFFAAARWARDTLQNPIVSSAEPLDSGVTDGLRQPVQQEHSDITPEHLIAPQTDAESSPTSIPPAVEVSESGVEGDIKAVVSSEARELPLSDEHLENVLREQFAPERLNRAMQTLNQYGTEEGLRRLKDSDPAVAKQLELLIQEKQENIIVKPIINYTLL